MEPGLLAIAREFISGYWPHVSGSAVAVTATAGTAIFAYIRRPKSPPTEASPYFTDAALLSPPLTRPAYSDRMAYVLAEMSDLAYYQFEGQRGFVDDAVENAMSLDLTDDTNVRAFLEKFSTELMRGRRLQLESMKKVLSNSGFSLLDVIDINETQGFACKRIAENEPPYLVLAFRGTEKKISDWLTDARCVRFLKFSVYRIANSSDIFPRVPPSPDFSPRGHSTKVSGTNAVKLCSDGLKRPLSTLDRAAYGDFQSMGGPLQLSFSVADGPSRLAAERKTR